MAQPASLREGFDLAHEPAPVSSVPGSASSHTSPRLASLPASPRDTDAAQLQSPLSPRSLNRQHRELPVLGELPHPSDLKAYAELFVFAYLGSLPVDENDRTILQDSVSQSAARGELRLTRKQRHAPYVEMKKIEELQRAQAHHALVAEILEIPLRDRVPLPVQDSEVLPADAGAKETEKKREKEKSLNLTVTVANVFKEEFFKGDLIFVCKIVEFFLEIRKRFAADPSEMEVSTLVTKGTPHASAGTGIPGTVLAASPALLPYLQKFADALFADGSVRRSTLPRKFLSALRSMDRMALGMCQFAVGDNDPKPGRLNVENFRRNLLVQFLVTRGVSHVVREVCGLCTAMVVTDPAIFTSFAKYFNSYINTASLGLVVSVFPAPWLTPFAI